MRSTLHQRPAQLAVLALAASVLAGCASGGGSAVETVGEADGIVTIYGAISGKEAELLEKSWEEWEAANGIDIQYEASREFEVQVGIRAQNGNAPDLALFPQPGYISNLAELGFIQPAPEAVVANVTANWSTVWTEYGTTDGVLYAAPLTTTVQGLIWYSPSSFEQWGLQVPATWEELMVVTDAISNQEVIRRAPWCAGFASDASTGAAGTDWIETVLIRQSGTETYDKWVSHEIPFTDPAVQQAFDTAGRILQDPYLVNAGFGRVDSINTTSFEEVASALGSGKCALHHQASFFESYLQDPDNGNVTVARDGDIWAFLAPPMEGQPTAVTVGGEFVAAFSNDADTVKVQEYLSTADWANSRASLGGVVSANREMDMANLSSPILREATAILRDPNTKFRFDASNLMPGVVGAGSFFTGMTDWIAGKPTPEVLAEIEASWPTR